MGTPVDTVADAAARLHALAVADGNTALAKSARQIVQTIESFEGRTESQTVRATVLKGASSDEDRFLLRTAWPADRLTAKGADGFVDIAGERSVELGAWRFAAKGFRTGVGHKPGGEDACRVVESSIWRGPDWLIKAADGSTQIVRKGDWIVGLLLSPDAWADYKAGRFGGISMQGKAARKPASAETRARLRT